MKAISETNWCTRWKLSLLVHVCLNGTNAINYSCEDTTTKINFYEYKCKALFDNNFDETIYLTLSKVRKLIIVLVCAIFGSQIKYENFLFLCNFKKKLTTNFLDGIIALNLLPIWLQLKIFCSCNCIQDNFSFEFIS